MCISFLLHQGMAVNAKSSNPKRINENLKATQVQLDTEDMSRIRGIDRGLMLFKVYKSSHKTFLTISCMVVLCLWLFTYWMLLVLHCIARDGAVSKGGGDMGPGLGSNNRCRLWNQIALLLPARLSGLMLNSPINLIIMWLIKFDAIILLLYM